MELKLRMELMDGQVFQDWQEGTIKFPPTYKYYPNSDIYYGSVDGKKGEKRRAPAWYVILISEFFKLTQICWKFQWS